MPFDPSKPVVNSPNSSAEMRDQLNVRNQNINDIVNAAIAGTSSSSNGVGTLGQSASGGCDQSEMQQVLDKIDEVINALRR